MNKTLIAVLIASTFVSSAYAARSGLTEPLVGHKPTLTSLKTGVSGELALGKMLTADAELMGFDDSDLDLINPDGVEYVWIIDGAELQRSKGTAGKNFIIPKNNIHSGKNITLKIVPATLTGDPKVGNEYIIANLLTAGATGGDGSGNITPDASATPVVSNLSMTGSLQAGKPLAGTYDFDANGGEPTDRSTHTWSGNAAGQLAQADAIAEGEVAPYTLTVADVGEIIELSVLAKNADGTTGNTVTVDTAGNFTDTGPGSSGGTGGGSDNTTDGGASGDVTYQPAVDPTGVTIEFKSSATVDTNGVDGVRPVVGKDVLTAKLTFASPFTDPSVTNFTFNWLADGVDIKAVPEDGVAIFTAPAKDHNDNDIQGKPITVDVNLK